MSFRRVWPDAFGKALVLFAAVGIVLIFPRVGLAQNGASSSSESSKAATTCQKQVEKRAFYIALYHCHRAIEIDSTRSSLYILRGRAYLGSGRQAQALDDFDTALALNAGNHAAHYRRGMALHDLGRVQESIESVKRAIKGSADEPDYYSLLGRFYESQSRYEKALEAYTVAVDLDPTHAWALSNRGVLLRDHFNDVEGAIRVFDKLDQQLEKPSRRARNYVARGSARMMLLEENLDDRNRELAVQAEKDFTAALELFPEYVQARYNRGRAREAQFVSGDTTCVDKAIRDYTDVTTMIGEAPRSLVAEAYFRRGILYASTGDQRTATESIMHAARLGMTSAQRLLEDRGIQWEK